MTRIQLRKELAKLGCTPARIRFQRTCCKFEYVGCEWAAWLYHEQVGGTGFLFTQSDWEKEENKDIVENFNHFLPTS